MCFGRTSGDSGDNPVGAGARAFPLPYFSAGDSGNKPLGWASLLVPLVPTGAPTSGDTVQLVKTGLSPLSPLFPLKQARA
jgi:hypothetical protein